MTSSKHLSKIRQLTDRRRKYQARINEIDELLKAAVRDAMADGLTAPAIAEVAGLSRERIYQLRNGRH